MADLHDPSSVAYKRARHRYIKTTRNRDPGTEHNWSPFRAAEKRYKARFPPPDLADVLDLAVLDDSRGGWKGCSDAMKWREVCVDDVPRGVPGGVGVQRKGFVIPRIPGLVLLPAFVTPERQRSLIRVSLKEQARHPNETNLDVHYILPEEGLWNMWLRYKEAKGNAMLIQPRRCDPETVSEQPGPRKLINNTPATPSNFFEISTDPKLPPVPSITANSSSVDLLLAKLRWANIGYFYHWGSKQYDFSKGKGIVHEEFRDICKDAVRSVHWEDVFGEGGEDEGWDDDDWRTWKETYEPDAGIVNFYQTKDTLMAHVDRSEVCATSPLVSISLGNAAVFLIGGLTRDAEPVPILLRSGDVVIMSGPACRRAYHGVPRILEGSLPPHLKSDDSDDDPEWRPYGDYIRKARININVRQVFPKGFEP